MKGKEYMLNEQPIEGIQKFITIDDIPDGTIPDWIRSVNLSWDGDGFFRPYRFQMLCCWESERRGFSCQRKDLTYADKVKIVFSRASEWFRKYEEQSILPIKDDERESRKEIFRYNIQFGRD